MKMSLSKWQVPALTVLALVQALWSVSALAQSDSAITADLQVCATLQVPAAKEACYDNLAKHAAQQNQSVAKPEQPKPEAPKPQAAKAPTSAPSAKPIVAAPVVAKAVDESDEDDAADEPGVSADAESYTDTVKSLKKLGQQERYSITLESGQMWRQTVSKSFFLREGDKVRLEGVAGGTYRLYIDGKNGFIRVKRFM